MSHGNIRPRLIGKIPWMPSFCSGSSEMHYDFPGMSLFCNITASSLHGTLVLPFKCPLQQPNTQGLQAMLDRCAF